MPSSNQDPSKSPLKRILEIRREEWPLTGSMFLYFFLIITTFWVLKPLKKGLLVSHHEAQPFTFFGELMSGAQAEQLAKVLNMVVALLAATVFSWLARRLRRQQLTYVFSAFVGACAVAFWFLLVDAGVLTIWAFYLFGDLYNTLMLATFFAFLNDSVRADTAKRIYGLVGLGGVSGGAVGAIFVRSFIETLSRSQWMWVVLAVTAVIVGLATYAGRHVDATLGRDPSEPARSEGGSRHGRGWAGFEGARLVFSSRYLLSILAIICIYETVSTIMDFQFTQTVEHFRTGAAIGKTFATVFTVTNVVALVVQLFLTSYVMRRFGVGVALLFLPVAAALGSTAFLIAPVFLFGLALNTLDNGFNYSINQSAKEALYVTTTRDEKYLAKAFIDMFALRTAKAFGVGLNLLVSGLAADVAGARWLSIATLTLVCAWLFAVRYAGRTFKERESSAYPVRV